MNKKNKNYKKIFLTGTHCSGKSTLLNWVNDKNIYWITCYDEMIRYLAKIPNFRFTFDPKDKKSIQQYIMAEKCLSTFYKGVAEFGVFDGTKLIVQDRCIIDPLYYTQYFELEHILENGLTVRQSLIEDIQSVIKLGYFKEEAIVLLLKPLPLDIEDDFRLKGVEIQQGVYNEAKSILRTFDINYLEVSVEEAKKIIDDVIFTIAEEIIQDKKYELVKLTEEDLKIKSIKDLTKAGKTLYRIKALRDFSNVKKGDIGGFVEKEDNLSHEGNCWIYDNAKVWDNARILDNANVGSNAEVCDNARIIDDAEVWDNAEVWGNVKVGGKVKVCCYSNVGENVNLFGAFRVGGEGWLNDGDDDFYY